MNQRPKDTACENAAISAVVLLSAEEYQRLRSLEGCAMHVSDLSDEELSTLEYVEIPGQATLCGEGMAGRLLGLDTTARPVRLLLRMACIESLGAVQVRVEASSHYRSDRLKHIAEIVPPRISA